MYTEVVVLTYQAPDIQTYTYEIPKELEENVKIGQLVSVPFGKREPMGIIIDIKNKLSLASHPEVAMTTIGSKDSIAEFTPNNKILRSAQNDRGEGLQNDKRAEIKPISTILLNTPILLPYQIGLLKWMSDYYHATMVNCLEAMLPEIPKRSTTHPRGVLQTSPRFHPGGETGNQTLILVPSINRLPETLAAYPQAKNHVVYHAEQKIGERFNNWLKILSGNADYIFGSRSAIFTPCPYLKKIIIFDEHDGAYKDERSPYYDTLTIAEKISRLTGAQIQIFDSAPRVTTYFTHGNTIYSSNRSSVILSEAKNPNKAKRIDSSVTSFPQNDKRGVSDKNPKVKIVSMLDEKAAGNKSPISDLLAEYLKAAAIKQKSVLLFLNKKIESGHVYCRSCKYNEYAAKQPEFCPSCRSADIWFNSLNISSLANLVRKIVPEVNINIISNAHPRGVIQTSHRLHPEGEISDIDIATAIIFYKLTPQKYDLVAHVATDTGLNISDITSNEKVYSQIMDLKKLTRGLLILQTHNPDHVAIKTAATSEYQTFFNNQLEERKALTYPPFSLLVKLSLRGKIEEKVESQAQKLYEELSAQLPNYPTTQLPTILGPYKPVFSKPLRYNIILKIPVSDYSLESRQKALEKTKQYFSQVPKNWQIIIEPETVN